VARARRRGRHRAQSTEHGARSSLPDGSRPGALRRPPPPRRRSRRRCSALPLPLAAGRHGRYTSPRARPGAQGGSARLQSNDWLLRGLGTANTMADGHIPRRCPPQEVHCLAPKSLPKSCDQPESRSSTGAGAWPCTHEPAHAHKINRDSGLRERAYLHAASRQVISQEIAELEAARTSGRCHQPAAAVSAAVLGVPHEPPSADGEPSYGDHVEQL
jgi:hypothetical protein